MSIPDTSIIDGPKLKAVCHTCKKPANGLLDAIHVSRKMIHKIADYEKHAIPVTWAPVGLADIPRLAQWEVICLKCRQSANHECYGECRWFYIKAFETWRDLLRITSHLMTKWWLRHTDWHVILDSAYSRHSNPGLSSR